VRRPHRILGIGELLWDILPAGPHLGGVGLPNSLLEAGAVATPIEEPARIALLGGAPANFTVMAGRLGNHAIVLSRIGRDDLGRMAVDQLEPLPVDTSVLQLDSSHPTGRVTVKFFDGEPRYTIHQPAAWDFFDLTEEWIRLAERADAICFGSLAQRSGPSRRTIQQLAAATTAKCIRVFDVNLRPPFITSEVLQESLGLSTVAKMNENELPQVLQLLGLPTEDPGIQGTLRSGASRLLSEFPGLRMVAITRGSRGSLLATREEWNDHPGFPVKVADGIGAGDAFTAGITHYMLQGAPLATLNEAGNRWGGWVASQSGAMPALPDEVRDAIAAAIER
jgi:fructokinase